MTRAAIHIDHSELTLRFPSGDFHDTLIRGLSASKEGSTAGDVSVQPWSAERIRDCKRRTRRWDRYGRHVVRGIRAVGRPVLGDGLVQRLASRFGVPLQRPPKSNTIIQGCKIDGRGWL